MNVFHAEANFADSAQLIRQEPAVVGHCQVLLLQRLLHSIVRSI